MRGTAALLVIVLFAPVLSGCLNWNEHNNEFYDCDSEEYWVDVSEDSPYPGLECESGPGRQLFITIFVYRDNEGVEWLINETSIATGVELINSVTASLKVTTQPMSTSSCKALDGGLTACFRGILASTTSAR